MSLSSYPQARRGVKTGAVRTRAARRLLHDLKERMDQQHSERAERWQAIQAGTETTPATHPILARLNEIQYLGQIDKRGGVHYTYEGVVGTGAQAERMFAQVTEWQGDVCVCFWGAGNDRFRRLLVTERGDVWIAIGLRAIRHTGKYLAAWRKIAQVRVTHAMEVNRG